MRHFDLLVLLGGLWVMASIFRGVIYYFEHREGWKP